MAWTVVPTFFPNNAVLFSDLNTLLRDNLNAGAVHQHNALSGQGSDVLSGVQSIKFNDIATPTAPGAAKGILYAKTTSVDLRIRAASGAEVAISLDGHTH